MKNDEPRHTIQQVANLTRYSKSSLRRWEREGLITPHRTPGSATHPGYRLYSDNDVQRIKDGLK